MSPIATLAQLRIYPVKSLGGVAVPVCVLDEGGLVGDREWMLVDSANRYFTQRQWPSLARIRATKLDKGIQLQTINDETIQITPDDCVETTKVTVWKQTCSAHLAPQSINDWISAAVGSSSPLRLVYFDKRDQRPTDPIRFGNYHTYFSDGAPYLLTNQSSLNALNQHLAARNHTPMTMDRFRPNLVVEGLPAFAEHTYTQMVRADGKVIFGLQDHCKRCAVITVDQTTGIRIADGTLLTTIAEVNAMPTQSTAPAFGVNVVLLKGQGEVAREGDQFSFS